MKMMLLKDWISQAGNSNNQSFIDSLQESFFQTTAEAALLEPDLMSRFSYDWNFKGDFLKEQYFKKASVENDDEIFISFHFEQDGVDIDEEFEGYIDQNGDGYGKFIKRNVQNGLEEIIVSGNLQNGFLHGKVRETVRDRSFSDAFYFKGVRNGFFRKFRLDKVLQEVGIYVQGRRTALAYVKRCNGGSYIFGSEKIQHQELPKNETNNEIGIRNCIFIYPDLLHAIEGRFKLKLSKGENDLGGQLLSGHYCQLDEIQFKYGLPFPKVCKILSEEIKFDPSTSKRISSNPLQRDLYEDETVHVGESSIPFAGEGLFAKRRIPAGGLVCLFNGIKCCKNSMPRRIPASHELWSDYRLNLDKSTDLDIPDEFIDTTNYRATLGHKACHSFKLKNSVFKEIFHPRFGKIMSVVAVKDIEQGEEIFVNYNYSVSMAPEWYKKLWFEHLRSDLGWTEVQIHDWTQREIAKWGYQLEPL